MSIESRLKQLEKRTPDEWLETQCATVIMELRDSKRRSDRTIDIEPMLRHRATVEGLDPDAVVAEAQALIAAADI